MPEQSLAIPGTSPSSWSRSGRLALGLLVALVVIIGAATPLRAACTDSVLVFGPKKYTKSTSGSWVIYDEEPLFSAIPDSIRGWRYVVEVDRGSSNPSACKFVLDGTEWVGSSEGCILKSVFKPELQDDHDGSVWISGPTGSSFWLKVMRVREKAFDIYGPTTFVRPATIGEQTATFDVGAEARSPYTLRVYNGDPLGNNRVTNATLHINTAQVLSASDFGTGFATITRTVSLTASDTIKIYNQSADSSRLTVTVTATDSTAPALTLSAPADSFLTKGSGVWITGSVTDETQGWLSITGRPPIATPNSFSDSLPLTYGFHTLTIQATNGACLSSTLTRVVAKDTLPPVLTVSWPSASSMAVDSAQITIQGTWSDLTRAALTIDGAPAGYGYSGTFSRSYDLDHGPNRILIRAVDQLGHTSDFLRIVFRGDSNETAPSLSPSVLSTTGFTPFIQSIQFLYTGESPIQTGVTVGAIDSARASVVRGRVLGRDWGPLRNVVVSVLGHPELGETRSRSDGWFDMAVNGGGPLILRFRKVNYLEAQRQVTPAAQGYRVLDDVALIGMTANRTVVDSSSALAGRGRFATDANGDRDLRLLFTPGFTAKIPSSSSGDSVELASVQVRATEYTVGSQGPPTMPGQLPPSSAYTYCVDLRLVEADSIAQSNGTSPDVRFTKPVTLYLRNFLQVPIGTWVPTGYYDQALGQWLASGDGVVLKILSTPAGTDSIDSNGDGVGDGQSRLDSLGIVPGEIARLKTQFAAGDTVWRVSTNHFSTLDLNFGAYISPALVAVTLKKSALWVGRLLGLVDRGCVRKGSIIDCNNRTLGERIPIVGTEFSLNYHSYRMPGDVAIRTIRVPVTDSETPPDELERIIVTVDVAGRELRSEISKPFPLNHVVEIPWDGLDAYGRRIEGSVNAVLSVGYRYGVEYMSGSGLFALGDPASNGIPIGSGTGDRNIGRTSWVRRTVSLGAPGTGSDALGGWTLSGHHFLDRTGQGAIYFGDGGYVLGDRLRSVLAVIKSGTCVKGDLSTGVSPAAIALGPDGSLYIADNCRGAILRRDQAGVLHKIAGHSSGNPGVYSGDGVALATSLKNFTDLVVAADGTVYFTTKGYPELNNIVGKVTTDGMIKKIIGGTYTVNGAGDGGPVSAATISDPLAIALGPDGSLFVSDGGGSSSNDNRIRRIAPNGIINTYAGNGQSPGAGNDLAGKATTIALQDIEDLAVDDDGNLFLAETQNSRVRRVSPDGMMTTYVRPPIEPSFFKPRRIALSPDGALFLTCGSGGSSDGQAGFFHRVWRRDLDSTLTTVAGGGPVVGVAGVPAEEATIYDPSDVAFQPDGTYFLSTTIGSGSILRIGQTLTQQEGNELRAVSEDGTELYYFHTDGRHLRTRDALTGVTLRTFNYDSGNRLKSIYDVNGDSTIIDRNAGSGAPEEIISPYGLRTTLGLAGPWLSSVTNPAGENTLLFATESTGLLDSLRDAEGHRHVFRYGADGRLLSDEDGVGALQELSLAVSGLTRSVTHETGEGRETVYRTMDRNDGRRRREVVGTDLLTTTFYEGVALRDTMLLPDQTRISQKISADPRFGMLAPYVTQRSMRLPSDKMRSVTVLRTYDPAGFNPPLIDGERVEEISINGRPDFESRYNSSTRRLTVTSPEGRVTTTAFDAAGRPVWIDRSGLVPLNLGYDARGRLQTATQGGREWSFTYDGFGRLKSTEDPLGRLTTFLSDSANRVRRQTFPDSSKVRFAYYRDGNLASLTTARDSVHGFEYSAAELNSRYVPPSAGLGSPATSFGYDLDRQLTTVSRPGGANVTLGYETATGRLQSLTQARGVGAFSYHSSTGHLQTVTSPDTVTVTYEYDGPLVTKETWSGKLPGGASREVASSYNTDFLLETQTVVGDTASFAYDRDLLLARAGRLDLVRGDSTGLVTGSSVVGSNVTSSVEYSALGELSKLTYRYSGSLLFEQTLSRDDLGRIVTIAENAFGTSQTLGYRYDLAGRLYGVTVDGDTVARYFYDGNGNRTGWDNGELSPPDTASAWYDGQDRLRRYRDTVYEWSDAGELVRKIETIAGDTTTYDYDPLGNLVKVKFDSGDSVTYVVDGLQRRVGKKRNGVFVRGWLYGDGLPPVAELDGSGALVNRYVYGEAGHAPVLMHRGGVVYRVVTDYLGSVRGLVNVASGAVAEERRYDAWGIETIVGADTLQSLGYAGGLGDPETGLVRFGARDYEPGVGRWTQREWIPFYGYDANLFLYSHADPINHQDPSGFATVTNRTGLPLIVRGGSGSGFGTGGTRFAVVPSNGVQYGKGNPLATFATLEEAETHAYFLKSQDAAAGIVVPETATQLSDVDFFYDKAGDEHKVVGDDIGPHYVLTTAANGTIIQSFLASDMIGAAMRDKIRDARRALSDLFRRLCNTR